MELCEIVQPEFSWDGETVRIVSWGTTSHEPINNLKRMPLQVVVASRHGNIVNTLFEAGADVNAGAAKAYGRTVLQAAIKDGHQVVMTLLMSAGAAINAPSAKLEGWRHYRRLLFVGRRS